MKTPEVALTLIIFKKAIVPDRGGHSRLLKMK